MSHKFNGGRGARVCDTCRTMVTEGSTTLRSFVERTVADENVSHYCDAPACIPPEGSDGKALAAAASIVSRIVADIAGRKGLRHQWNSIDDDIRDEIVAKWRGIAAEGIEAARDELSLKGQEEQ